MGNKKLCLAFTIISGIIFSGAFILTLVFLINGFAQEYRVATYVLFSVIPLSSFLFVYFFNKYMRENVGKVYDKASEACNEIDEADFLHNHEIGEVLGVCAVI